MTKEYGMKSLPRSEQPYEKAQRLGISALSDAELLAVIIRSGSAEKSALETAYAVLKETGGLYGLAEPDNKTLEQIPGIGRVKSIQLSAVGEIARRMWAERTETELNLSEPAAIYRHYRESMRYLSQEEVWLLLLDNRMNRIREVVVTRGTVNCSLVSPRDIFRLALKHRAVCFVLMHNHPSGNPTPSTEDRQLTEKVKQLGDMLQLPMLDHIVFGSDSYYSFHENHFT